MSDPDRKELIAIWRCNNCAHEATTMWWLENLVTYDRCDQYHRCADGRFGKPVEIYLRRVTEGERGDRVPPSEPTT